MRVKNFISTLLVSSLVLLCISCGNTKKVSIRILNTTDVHGNILPNDEINDKAATGGYSRFYTFLQQARKETPNLVLIDNGDLLQGEPITYYSNYIDTISENVVAKAMNILKYDVATMGNHDIETGLKVFDKWKNECKFPVLGANVIDTRTNEPYLTPYKIFDIDGIKLAVIGVVTAAIPQWVPQERWENLRFDDIKETLNKWIPKVKESEKADIIVASLHSGWNDTNTDYIENASEQVAKEVDGIDLILCGHDHQKYMNWVKKNSGDSILVINPSNHLDFVSDITIDVEKKGDKVSKKVKADFVDMNQYEPNEEFVSQFKNEQTALTNFLNETVGVLEYDVNGKDALFGFSPYMALIHEMQLYTMDADISFAAPLSTKSHIGAGDVKVKDLFKFCPFTNYLYVMELTGKQILGYLQHSYRGWVTTMTDENSNMILYKDNVKKDDKYKTKTPNYNYSSAYGIDYYVDVSKSPVEISISQMSDGKPFDMNKTYKVVMTSYRAGGAGGMLTEGAGIPKEELKSRIVAKSPNDQLDNIMKYFKVKGVVKVGNRANWSFIPTQWVENAVNKDKDFIFGQQ